MTSGGSVAGARPTSGQAPVTGVGAGARRVTPGIGTAPSLREERRLLRSGHRWLAAIDEVGRGALAGPVSVGVVVVDLSTRSAPSGVRDSKLLTPGARIALVPRVRRWAPWHAVGHAQPGEIDRIGIIAALRLAAARALRTLPVQPDCALLDGSHDWLSVPAPDVVELTEPLFDLRVRPDPGAVGVLPQDVPPRVVTQVKADLRCAAVAAASVLAKVERDSIMVGLAAAHPDYGWADNKGYSAPEHVAALRRLGPCELHRRSWNLPGVGLCDDDGVMVLPDPDPSADPDVDPDAGVGLPSWPEGIRKILQTGSSPEERAGSILQA